MPAHRPKQPPRTAPTPPPFAYRPDLDGLRAVAVIAVVVYHFAPPLAPGGFVGVDVFFVLSGFLITALTHRRIAAGTFRLWDFYARRVRRLLPALLSVLLATTLAGRFLYGPVEQAALGAASAASALFGANVHFYFTSDYFSAPVETQPLLHLWSLGVEEQFYMVAPLVLLWLAAWPRMRLWATGLAVLASFGAGSWATHHTPSAAFYLPMYRAWELGLGALLALRPIHIHRPWARSSLGLLGLGAILGATLLFDASTPFPGVAALLPTLGTATLLVAGPTTPTGRLLSLRPFRAVGRWSYAWYLWHWPVLAFATFWWMRPPTPPEALALGLASLAVAAASTQWLELPLRHRAMDQPRRVVAGGLLALAALTVTSGSMWAAHRPSGPEGALLEVVADALHAPAPPCQTPTDHGRQAVVCAVGTPRSPLDVVLWGDSHADRLGMALDALARREGLGGRSVARFDCLPLLGIDRRDVYAEHQCAKHNDLLMDYLEEVGVRTVVLHARWPLYVAGSRYGDTGTLPRLVRAGSRNQDVDLPSALDRTLDRLHAIGAQVVILGSVPEVRFHVPSVLARATRLGRPPPPGPTRQEFEDRRAGVTALFAPVRARPGVHYIDPATVLCDSEQCSISTEAGLLYADDNHLSGRGATQVVELLRPRLLPDRDGGPAPARLAPPP